MKTRLNRFVILIGVLTLAACQGAKNNPPRFQQAPGGVSPTYVPGTQYVRNGYHCDPNDLNPESLTSELRPGGPCSNYARINQLQANGGVQVAPATNVVKTADGRVVVPQTTYGLPKVSQDIANDDSGAIINAHFQLAGGAIHEKGTDSCLTPLYQKVYDKYRDKFPEIFSDEKPRKRHRRHSDDNDKDTAVTSKESGDTTTAESDEACPSTIETDGSFCYNRFLFPPGIRVAGVPLALAPYLNRVEPDRFDLKFDPSGYLTISAQSRSGAIATLSAIPPLPYRHKPTEDMYNYYQLDMDAGTLHIVATQLDYDGPVNPRYIIREKILRYLLNQLDDMDLAKALGIKGGIPVGVLDDRFAGGGASASRPTFDMGPESAKLRGSESGLSTDGNYTYRSQPGSPLKGPNEAVAQLQIPDMLFHIDTMPAVPNHIMGITTVFPGATPNTLLDNPITFHSNIKVQALPSSCEATGDGSYHALYLVPSL